MTLQNYQFDDAMSQKLLVKTIIAHEYPFNYVEYMFTREYLLSFRPAHHIPSHTTITKMCMEIYAEYKKNLFDLFANSSIKVCFTMVKWTSFSQNKSSLCIISHFVDESWSLQQRLIEFINVHDSIGMDICNVFMDCLLEWNPHDKVLTVTINNDTANDVALRLARDRLKNSLPYNGVFFHVRCGIILSILLFKVV